MSDLARLAVKIERVAKDLTDAKLLQSVGMEGKKIATGPPPAKASATGAGGFAELVA